jgi:hypothetical protein
MLGPNESINFIIKAKHLEEKNIFIYEIHWTLSSPQRDVMNMYPCKYYEYIHASISSAILSYRGWDDCSISG